MNDQKLHAYAALACMGIVTLVYVWQVVRSDRRLDALNAPVHDADMLCSKCAYRHGFDVGYEMAEMNAERANKGEGSTDDQS